MREILTTCDRCDKEVRVDAKTIRLGLATWSECDFHVCGDCRAEFEAWMGQPKRAAREARATKAGKA